MSTKKLYPFVSVLVISILLSACGNSKPTIAATPENTQSSTPATTASEPVVYNGTTYNLNGASGTAKVNEEKGYIVYEVGGRTFWFLFTAYPMTVVEGNNVVMNWYAAEVNPANESVIAPMECFLNKDTQNPIFGSGSDMFKAAQNVGYDIKCIYGTTSWSLTAHFDVTVLSALTLVTPVPPVAVIPWNQLTEGENYLLCNDWSFKYEDLEGPKYTDNKCIMAKILYRDIKRVLYNNKVVTITDDAVVGGFPRISAANLVPGRTYYFCDLKRMTGPDGANLANWKDDDGCIGGIFVSLATEVDTMKATISAHGLLVTVEPVNTGGFASIEP